MFVKEFKNRIEKLKVYDIIHRPIVYLKTRRFGGWILDLTIVQASPEDGDRIQSPKRRVLNKRQDDG
jgi:DNA-binding Lrp family transcriptional regulator